MKMTTERLIEIYNDPDRIGGIIIRGNSEEDTDGKPLIYKEEK